MPHYLHTCGKMLQNLAVTAIVSAYGNHLETRQNIEFGQSDAGNAVHPDRMTQAHGIEPAAATRSSGCGAELKPFAFERFSVRPVDLRGKRATPYSRGICLGYPNDLMNVPRPNTRAVAHTTGDRVRRSNEGISSVIHI